MSATIELMSSEDEQNEEPATNETAKNPTSQVPASALAVEKVATATDHRGGNFQTKALSSSPKKNTSSEPKISTQTASLQQEQRVHRRKSQHQTVRTSPDIEFESLSSKRKAVSGRKPDLIKSSSAPRKKHKNKISILASKPLTCEQLLDIEFNKFLKDDATISLIREIAAERVRINELLSINFMPKIKFSLYTKRETLEFQLAQRFKQKEICLKSLNDTNSK